LAIGELAIGELAIGELAIDDCRSTIADRRIED
jgi:hypothetical protein